MTDLKSNRYICHFNECFDILNSEKRTEHVCVEDPNINEIRKPNMLNMLLNTKSARIYKESLKNAVFEDEDDVSLPYYSSKKKIMDQFDDAIDLFVKDDFEPFTSDSNRNIIRSFEQMWEFAQFVRYAEKCIFYHNDITSPLMVDSKLDEESERIFAISKDDYLVTFKLKWIYDTTAKQTLKAINIKVSRNYGKQMSNEYTIVNGDVKLNDDSDYTLIEVINSMVYDATLDTYRLIMKGLLEFFEERTTFPCRV